MKWHTAFIFKVHNYKVAKSNLCHIYQLDMGGPDSANAAIILLGW